MVFWKSLQDVDENDIIVGIGYFMRKNYNEENKIENVLEHLVQCLINFDQLLWYRFVIILCPGTWIQYLLSQS